MKKIVNISLSLILVSVFTDCNDKPKGFYEYINLKDYKYSPSTIKEGSEVRLLAFSGGNSNDREHIYYYQFIVLEESTGDTIRVLAPLISVDQTSGLSEKTYTTPLQIDPAKGVTSAVYELMDSSAKLNVKIMSLASKDGISTDDINAVMKNPTPTEFVVIEKGHPIFKDPHYKTAIGTLNFSQVPW